METKTISVGGEIFRQIQEQTEKKCENCKHHRLDEYACQKCCSSLDNDYISFEQKPITLTLPLEAFKCPKEYHDAECYNCPIVFNGVEDGICKGYIFPEVGNVLRLTCFECGGNGIHKDVPEDCKTCKGKGGWKLKVQKAVHFIKEGNGREIDSAIAMNCSKEEIDLIKSMEKDGDYVLIEGEICK